MALHADELGGLSPFRLLDYFHSIGLTWLIEEELEDFWLRLSERARNRILLGQALASHDPSSAYYKAYLQPMFDAREIRE